MACFGSNKGSLEEDSYDGPVGGELSDCALAMLEKERESLPSPSESPGSSSISASLQAAAPIQGYDVEFDPPLESKYECPICLMALRNAIQTPCGHRFCKNCIEKSIRYAIIQPSKNKCARGTVCLKNAKCSHSCIHIEHNAEAGILWAFT